MKPTTKQTTSNTNTPPEDVDDYLASVPAEARTALEKLRRSVRTAAPEATEIISYGVPRFMHNGSPLVSFWAAKSFCSFYLMSPALLQAHAEDLKDFDWSKATIRFPSDEPLPAALVKKLVKARMAENATRGKKTK
jgi:uncharacterized protein YdhG (YjbR/CyaY superfamily)